MLPAKTALWACALPFLLLTLPGRAETGACPEERRRAAVVRERIEQEWPLREVDPVAQFIGRFGRSLAQQAGYGRAARWRFAVVRDYSVNAYSIGDGIIYLTEGAILIAADEAELAAILAHEMGHQLSGHFCSGTARLEERMPWWEVLLSPTVPAPSRRSATGDDRFGSLRRGIDPAKERDADRLATEILRSAGYDPGVRMELARRIARSQAAGTVSEHLTSSVQTAPDHGWQSRPLRQPGAELQRIQALLRKDH